MDRQQPREHLYSPPPLLHQLTTTQGRITSFYGATLERYTSYRGHAGSEGPVKQFLFTEKGVLSISKQSIHYAHRRGLTQWHLMYAWLGKCWLEGTKADICSVEATSSRISSA